MYTLPLLTPFSRLLSSLAVVVATVELVGATDTVPIAMLSMVWGLLAGRDGGVGSQPLCVDITPLRGREGGEGTREGGRGGREGGGREGAKEGGREAGKEGRREGGREGGEEGGREEGRGEGVREAQGYLSSPPTSLFPLLPARESPALP